MSGLSDPTPQELVGYTGPSTTSSSSGPKGVPCFWLNVLSSDVSWAWGSGAAF